MTGIEMLGATLLHFLWQGILIAAVYAAVRRGATRPEVRYLLACAAMAAMAFAPLATWIAMRPPSSDAVALLASVPAPHASSAATGVSDETLRFLVSGYESIPAAWLSWVATVWVAGVAVFWLRLLGGWMMAERLRHQEVRPAPAQWQQVLDRLRTRLRISRPVQLLVSGLVQAPVVVGLLRPVVLAPLGALAGLPADQMEALLLHELAHIRRYDYLVNALQSILEALLFYHPVVWWVSGHMRAEREMCCDDAAIAITGDALGFARALAQIGAAEHAHHRAAMAATGGSVVDRVARLLGVSRPASRTHSLAAVASAAVLVAITAMAVVGQTAALPKFEVTSFEVASVKPSPPGGLGSAFGGLHRGTFSATNVPLRMVLAAAYGLSEPRVVGPDWLDKNRFDIAAKSPKGVPDSEVKPMLQALLKERFKLVLHLETREMSVYNLVVAKGGVKMPVYPARDWAPVRPKDDRNIRGFPMLRAALPASQFADMLARIVNRPVLDKTGLTARYSIFLSYASITPQADDKVQEFGPPDIFLAIQEQLGLKLERGKDHLEVVVIDHIEPMPSEN
jgi:uncharacterized protein (TIGR03435 family)